MPGCRPPCVEIMYGPNTPTDVSLCRRKWNYVKNLYQGSYGIDASGNIDDPRDVSDDAYIADFVKYDAQFTEDYNTWVATRSGTDFERWLQWQYEVGTTMYGNLPQWKKDQHEGHCWMPCPYSTDSSDERSENMLGSVPTKVDHGEYYMATASKGSSWGFECTYSGCPHLLTNGTRYFYT